MHCLSVDDLQNQGIEHYKNHPDGRGSQKAAQEKRKEKEQIPIGDGRGYCGRDINYQTKHVYIHKQMDKLGKGVEARQTVELWKDIRNWVNCP